MTVLQQYEEACKALGDEFYSYILWEDYDPTFNRSNFVGNDFWLFSDGSDYYYWTPSQMYEILDFGIPYKIACEHADWEIDNGEKVDGWINLRQYWEKRSKNMELWAEDFQRAIVRAYHLDRASRLTDDYIEETKTQMQAIKDKFEKDIEEYIKK